MKGIWCYASPSSASPVAVGLEAVAAVGEPTVAWLAGSPVAVVLEVLTVGSGEHRW